MERATTDARGKTLACTYDKLGRKTEMHRGSADGTLLAEWTYDTLKKGQPTASIRYVDGHAYVRKVAWYDEQNRPVTKQVVIPEAEGNLAGTYTFRGWGNNKAHKQAGDRSGEVSRI